MSSKYINSMKKTLSDKILNMKFMKNQNANENSQILDEDNW